MSRIKLLMEIKEDAEKLNNKLAEIYPDMDIELIEGLQPIYYYIISLD